MKHADRLARLGPIRSGVFTGGENLKRERPFGLTLLFIITAVSVLVLSRACVSVPVNALVASAVTGSSSPSTGNSDYELRLPFISQRWPPEPVLSSCTPEDKSCN